MKKPTLLLVLPYGFNDRMMNFVESVSSRLLAKNGWNVLGVARYEADRQKESFVHGVHVYRFGGIISGMMCVLGIFLRQRPDIVHINALRNNRIGVFAAICAKIFRIPLVFTEPGLLHDHYLVVDRDDPIGRPIQYENVISTFSRIFMRPLHTPYRLKSYLFHFALTHADIALFYSKHNLAIAHALGISDVRYVPQILDDARFEPSASAPGVSSSILTKVPSEKFALFVGQMKARKGWDILLKAIPYVAVETMPKFVFISSSSKTETEEFTRMVDSLHIRERVVFLGAVESNRDLHTIFKKCSMVIVPSRYEGFGLVPLEAFEVSKPVIASRVEALTDFLEHGKNACLVSPKDPKALAEGIAEVGLSAELQHRLIAGGHETLTQMRSDAYHKEWLDFYNSFIVR